MLKFFIRLLAITTALLLLLTMPLRAENDPVIARIDEIHKMILDPQKTFSISKTLAELDLLQSKLTKDDFRSRGDIDYIRSYIYFQKPDPEQSILYARKALHQNDLTPFLTPTDQRYVYAYLGHQAKDQQQWPLAIEAFRNALAVENIIENSQPEDKLNLLHGLSYCLHENAEYQTAKDNNLQALTIEENLHGKDSEELLVTLTNLAQNTYMLKQMDEAKAYLERRLAIARKHQVDSHIDDSLFQLGVLAFENGDVASAQKLMEERLALAKQSGSQARIDEAQQALDELFFRKENTQ